MTRMKQWYVSTIVNNMMANKCALFLCLLFACWTVISGCTINKSGTLMCKSIEELHQMKTYKEFKNVEINKQGNEQWPIIKNDAFRGMKNLEGIVIFDKVSHFEPYALRGIEHPFTFWLDNNNLEELPAELFDGVPVSWILIAKTQLKDLKPKLFKNSPLLNKTLILENKLTTIGSRVFSNTNIVRVELSGNEIATIEDGAFAGMKKLHTLDLSMNKLTTFVAEKVLGSSSTIEMLYLGHNLLTVIPQFPTLPKLRILSFVKNVITTVESKCFDNLESLYGIDISFNKLKSIPADTLSGSLMVLGVGENPWTCSYLSELKAWAKNDNVTLFCSNNRREPCTVSCV